MPSVGASAGYAEEAEEMTGSIWYHGSKSGDLDVSSPFGSNFGGGLFLAREKIYAKDYARGGTYENVFAVRLRKGAKVFRPSSKAAVRKLARWLQQNYDYDFDIYVDHLSVDDLQSNSVYDDSRVQEGLDDLHYDVVATGEEALVLDAAHNVVGIRRLDENGKITTRRNSGRKTIRDRLIVG